jgi:tetratricopeptide (TPR) repeat protein
MKAVVCGVALAVSGLAFGHGDLDHQIAHVSADIKKSPKKMGLYLKRADLHRAHKDYAAALRDIAVAEAAGSGDAELFLLKGRTYYEAGKLKSSLESLNSSITADSENSLAYWYRALCLVDLGKRDAAEHDFKKALELTEIPGPELLIARVQNLSEAGRHAEALALVEGALNAGSRLLSYQILALDIECAMGDYAGAHERLDGLIRSAKLPETFYLRKAEVFEQEGKLTEAHASYQSAKDAILELSASMQRRSATQELLATVEAGLKRTKEES